MNPTVSTTVCSDLAEAVRRLPSFSHLFHDSSYITGYQDWRRGKPKGCKGEIVSAFSGAPLPNPTSIRQQYHAWCQGQVVVWKSGSSPTQLRQSCDDLLLPPACIPSPAQDDPPRPQLPSRPVATTAASCPGPTLAGRSSQKWRRFASPSCLDMDGWLSVLRHVSAADLNRCMSVCWSFSSVASSSFLWQSLAVSLDVRSFSSNDGFCRTLSALLERQVRRLKMLHLDESSLFKATGVLQQRPVSAIESLDLSGSAQLSAGPLSAVLQQLSTLGALDLSSWWWLQDEQLQQLLIAAPNLTDLNLSSCTKLTDAAPNSICTLRHLRRLNLRSCKHMGPAAVADIAAVNVCLTELDLSFCTRMTDKAVAALVNFTELEELRLNMCRKVSDVGIVKLAKHCAKLRHIELSWCTVGDATVHSLSKMAHLKFVNLVRCETVRESAHQMLCQVPGVEVKPSTWNPGMYAL